MSVSRDTLDKIKLALDPLAMIREAVPSLKQSGPRWKGNCPFHNERTPSFFFMPEKGLWHCFGACNEGGDIFKFVMKMENLTFPEALRELARRAGVTLDWDKTDDASSRKAREREALFSLLEEAAAFYHESLKKSADAEGARRHLAERKIRPETIQRFRLGYAPLRESFLETALKKGTPIETLLKTGLAVRSDRTGRYHDPMMGRLIFPISDPYGAVVAFGGRTLAEEEQGPKYLNSPETVLYTKGRQLYGLFQGRTALRERGQAVIVEGYMDVVGLHQAGFEAAVAPLGTALTREQSRLLRRYIQETVLLFDPDPAGVKASWRSAEVLLQEDVFVRVARVPDDRDPDEYVLEKGPAALDEALKGAQDVVDFWLDALAPSLEHFSDLHGRFRKAEELLRFIAGVPNAIWRGEWLKRSAKRLGFEAAVLEKELSRKSGAPAPVPAEPVRNPPPSAAARAAIRSAEEEALQVLSSHPDLWAGSPLTAGHFSDLRCRAVFERLSVQWKEDGRVDAARVIDDLVPADAGWLSALLMEGKNFEKPAESLALAARRLEIMMARRERQSLEREVQRMLEGQAPRDEGKITRYQTLTRTLQTAGSEKI